MRYGIDIHGTLACRREDKSIGPSTLFPLLKPLMAALVTKGERIAIVSGPTISIIEKEVSELGLEKGVHYHRLLSVVDYLKESGVEMWEDPPGSGHWWSDPEVWNNAKGRMAEHYAIDIIIDDQAEYSPAMPDTTEFVLVAADLLEKVPQLEDDLESSLRVAAFADFFGVIRPQHSRPFVRKRRMERVKELMADRDWEDDPEAPNEEEAEELAARWKESGMEELVKDLDETLGPPRDCTSCNGSGGLPIEDPPCPDCKGSGTAGGNKCPECYTRWRGGPTCPKCGCDPEKSEKKV